MSPQEATLLRLAASLNISGLHKVDATNPLLRDYVGEVLVICYVDASTMSN